MASRSAQVATSNIYINPSRQSSVFTAQHGWTIGDVNVGATSLPLGSDIWDQMKALRAERWQRQGYETELEAAVKVCQ